MRKFFTNSPTQALEQLVKFVVRLSGAKRDRLAFVSLVVLLQSLLVIALVYVALSLMHQDRTVLTLAFVMAGSISVTVLAHVLMRKTLFEKLWSLKAGLHEAERSRDEAVETSQEKSRMLATMSHEIRTPLNGVIGMLGLLLETELSAEQRNYAATAHGSGRTLLSFIDEILDGAKSEAQAKNGLQPIDILALVENVTELLAPRAHAKNIEIASRVDPALPPRIVGNDTKLRQLLFNLAGNAIKFTQSGGVLIEVKQGSESGSLCIAVSDTGIGMSNEEMERLFQAFTQANENTKRRFGGTGLGLYISREIVTALGGSLTVESESGRGSTFTAALPNMFPVGATVNPARPLAGRNYAILVEDGFTRSNVERLLTDLGAAVMPWVSVPREALQRSDHTLICDPTAVRALLPGAKTRQKRKQPLPQIWMLLTPEERRPVRHLLQKPVNGYLMRPIRRSTLIERLARADAEALKATGQRMQVPRQTKPAGRSLRVLVADDTPVNAFIARTLLQRAGHDVTIASSGQQALDALNSNRRFDLLILDVEMPGLSGPETAVEIRALEHDRGKGEHLPILALTANTRPEAVAECLASGMDAHLAKPFDFADLDDAIARVMRRQAA